MKLNKKSFYLAMLAACSSIVFSSCSDDEDDENTPSTPAMPSTYDFENVDYSGQTDRIDQLAELTTYMKTANSNTDASTVDSTTMRNMFQNQNDPFADADLNTGGKQIANKTSTEDNADQTIAGWMGEFHRAHEASDDGVAGSNGTPGVVVSKDGTKSYFFDANGFEHIQLIEKGIMGATFYYQTTTVYTSEDRIGPAVDNDSVVPGKGTDKQHHWDEAFGYLGVPTTFPDETEGLKVHGKYCNSRNGLLNTNSKIMEEGFIKGRYAINTNNQTMLDEAVVGVRKNYELVIAATAVHYLNAALNVYDQLDFAIQNHVLSEAYAFIWSLKFNPDQTATDAEIDQMLQDLTTNFYTVTKEDIQKVKDKMIELYPDLAPAKDQL